MNILGPILIPSIGSKSRQNASIFHEKNDGKVKKYLGCPLRRIELKKNCFKNQTDLLSHRDTYRI